MRVDLRTFAFRASLFTLPALAQTTQPRTGRARCAVLAQPKRRSSAPTPLKGRDSCVAACRHQIEHSED
jgi:hypothetical protein